MDTQQSQQSRRQLPNIQFRVLIIGRANAGKTSILQRICETTESPIVYRGKEEIQLDPSMDRGEHRIDDEIVFSNHTGYVFHDSRGIESGSTAELEILQEFIRRKCGEKQLRSRLHAIWYCVPMDNQRPQLDLKFYKDICPDRNVPVVAVFTKFDQFLRNVEMHLADYPDQGSDGNVSEVAEKRFQEHYLQPLGDDVRYVRLAKMHVQNRRCTELIENTAAALNEDILALMLFAVQRGNLELSVKMALKRVYVGLGTKNTEDIVRECLISFPYIWFYSSFLVNLFGDKELAESFRDGDWFGNGRRFGDEGYKFSSGAEGLERFAQKGNERWASSRLKHFTKQAVSLPTIQKLSISCPHGHHLILAIMLILKHATFLRLSDTSRYFVLTIADQNYQKANIDLKIQQHLTESSQEHSVEQLAEFILATDIVPPQDSAAPHEVHKDWFNKFWESFLGKFE